MSTYCFCLLLSPDEGMLEARKLMSRAKDAEISFLKARSEDDEFVHGSMTYVHLTLFLCSECSSNERSAVMCYTS